MHKNVNDEHTLFELIEKEYNTLKCFEQGGVKGANQRQLQSNPHMFLSVVKRLYSHVDELPNDLFSFKELTSIEDNKRALHRESQIHDVEEMIRVVMYDVNEVMKIIYSKIK